MQRLRAAEESLGAYEEVIESERDLRKQTSKQLKGEIKGLEGQVQHEKRSLSDKVAIELDSQLKNAVREKVETKKMTEKVSAEHDKL